MTIFAERRIEQAVRRPTSSSLGRKILTPWRAIVMAVGVASSLIVINAPSGHVVAVGPAVSGPAVLAPGLQAAERLSSTTPTGSTLEPEVQKVLDLVNVERAARDLAPLTYHPQLTEAALAHAADQASFNCLTTLSHTGTDDSNAGQRIQRTGLAVSAWGENIACNQSTAAAVMQAWMNSAGHRANILSSNFTHIGISRTLDSAGHPYWVQVFGTPS